MVRPLGLRIPLSAAIILLGLLCSPGPIWSQLSVDDHEKSIAALSPAERAYERFRFWFTQLPRDQRPAATRSALAEADLMLRYRTYLAQRGFSPAQVDEQIKIVEAQGSRSETNRWNRILTSETPTFNTKPNEFLVEVVRGRRPGTALDVGMGQGRNAIWLAQQGWTVTGFDPADKAVVLAQQTVARLGVKIQTEIKGEEDFDFAENRWDLILISYVGAREFPARVQRALRPGGILVIEGFHRDATKGRSIGPGVVFDTGELPHLFPELRAVRYEEPVSKADFGQQLVRVVRYCAVKP